MTDIRLDWNDPTARADGSALASHEIASINISLSADGVNFTSLASIAAGVQSYTQQDLVPGDYLFELVVIDTQNPPRSSAPVIVSATVPVPIKAVPGGVLNATATLL